jgi:hypothetical protein
MVALLYGAIVNGLKVALFLSLALTNLNNGQDINMNGYCVYKKDNGMYGLDRTLNGVYMASVKGQWKTREGARKKAMKLYESE